MKKQMRLDLQLRQRGGRRAQDQRAAVPARHAHERSGHSEQVAWAPAEELAEEKRAPPSGARRRWASSLAARRSRAGSRLASRCKRAGVEKSVGEKLPPFCPDDTVFAVEPRASLPSQRRKTRCCPAEKFAGATGRRETLRSDRRPAPRLTEGRPDDPAAQEGPAFCRREGSHGATKTRPPRLTLQIGKTAAPARGLSLPASGGPFVSGKKDQRDEADEEESSSSTNTRSGKGPSSSLRPWPHRSRQRRERDDGGCR